MTCPGVIELTLRDSEIGIKNVVFYDNEYNRQQIINCRAPFIHNVCYRPFQDGDNISADTVIYLPKYHAYMKTIKMWLIGDMYLEVKVQDQDFQELLSIEKGQSQSTRSAYRIIIKRDDYIGTFYIPATPQNDLEIYMLKQYRIIGVEIDYVSIEFAKEHPKYFRKTGFLKEECFYLETIQVPRNSLSISNKSFKDVLVEETF